MPGLHRYDTPGFAVEDDGVTVLVPHDGDGRAIPMSPEFVRMLVRAVHAWEATQHRTLMDMLTHGYDKIARGVSNVDPDGVERAWSIDIASTDHGSQGSD